MCSLLVFDGPKALQTINGFIISQHGAENEFYLQMMCPYFQVYFLFSQCGELNKLDGDKIKALHARVNKPESLLSTIVELLLLKNPLVFNTIKGTFAEDRDKKGCALQRND